MNKSLSYFLFLLLLVSTKLHAQNVGIGTTTPVNKLSVNGKMDIRDSLGIGTTNPSGQLHVKTSEYTSLDQQQSIYNFVNAGTLFWQSFTAGTTGLLAKVDLRINSPIALNQSIPGTINIFNGEGNSGTLLSSTNVIFLPVDTTFKSFSLSTSPAVVAGNVYTIEFSVLGFSLNAYSNSGNPYPSGRANLDPDQDFAFKTYITSQASDALVVVDGKVGINTTSPVKELDVAGSTKTTNLQITNGASNGSILKSDAAGNANWTPISTIETDPQVGTLTLNKIPKWNGSALADGVLFDNGLKVGIGTNTPAGEFHVKSIATNIALDQQQNATNIVAGSNLHWQSFTAGITGLLTSIDLQVSSPISTASTGTIKIFSGEGNNGALLSTTNVVFQPVSNTFQSFSLSSATPIVANNIYTIEFSVPNVNRNWVYVRTGNLYPNGRSNISINEDYVFKTYVSKVSDVLVVFDGKLGINNTSPEKDLDVAGSIKTTNLQLTNGATNGFILKSDATGNASWVNVNTLTITEADPKVGTLTSNKVPKWNGTTLADGLLFDNGTNVGIGTNSPTSKLSIIGNSDITGTLGIGTNAPAAKLHVASSSTGLRIDVPPTQTAFSIGGAGSLKVDAIGVEGGRLLINDNGNIGIGNINPITTLDVNGGIRTRYSGTVVFDVVGGGVRTLSIPISSVPGDWNINNTIVIVTNADGVDGIVRQARLSNTTTIDVKYFQDTNGPVRLNWVIFRM
jgi:hypothetical protein